MKNLRALVAGNLRSLATAEHDSTKDNEDTNINIVQLCIYTKASITKAIDSIAKVMQDELPQAYEADMCSTEVRLNVSELTFTN